MIQTSSLTIRRVKTSDWKDVKEIWAKVAKTEYAQYDNPKDTSDEAVEKRIKKWDSFSDSNEHMFFAVCHERKVIGYVAFNKRDTGYEIGYCFNPDYHRKGYAKESITKLINELHKKGINHFTAGTAINNIPSVKLLYSLNFKLVSTEQVSFYKDNLGNDIYFEGGNFELKFNNN